MIQKIKKEELRTMNEKETLILRGCGGDLQEWVDGISGILRDAGILKGDFQNCAAFQDGDITCLLFPFEGADLDVGKLAMWRLQTMQDFHGIWLSDFVDNHLGGFRQKKPDCPLIGQNGNVFHLIAKAAQTLKQNNLWNEAEEMQKRALHAGSYMESLSIIGDYVNITSSDEAEDESESMHME